jgi:aminocarboxymuconate-semialdehyde decarboxylase
VSSERTGVFIDSSQGRGWRGQFRQIIAEIAHHRHAVATMFMSQLEEARQPRAGPHRIPSLGLTGNLPLTRIVESAAAPAGLSMHIIDSHFHWWPRSIFDKLCKRGEFPKARVNKRGGYDYMRGRDSGQHLNSWAEWFDLDKQFEYMDSLGHRVDVVCSIGPFSVSFSDMPVGEGRDYALMWNEEMAGAQKKYPGRLWASAAVPLQDTRVAIEVVDDAVNRLGLMGVNLPGSVGADARIDAERLEPFYAHCEKLGLPLFLHPTDVIFQDILDGYDGALHLSLGRVIEVSVAAMRLILSGMMERHPKLKIVMSHTGGSLPYQAGRMDKNSKKANLPKPVTDYMRRMYTDTVSPHSAGIKFAIDYYGIDHVMNGTDYPCWDPAPCLKLIDEIKLSAADKQKLFYDNARRILNLKDSAPAKSSKREPALA